MAARIQLPVLGGAPPVAPSLSPTQVPASFARDGRLPALTDRRGRAYRYLRLSVTDRCNMACTYCMPPEGERDHALRRDLMTFEEVTRVARIFAAMGIKRVRLTGGEPLLRRDLPDLVASLRDDAGIEEIWLTTNGTRLPQLAAPLARAGLRGVNVSMDSLDPARFSRITRGGNLAEVQAGIAAAQDEGLAVKLNSVALRNGNADELADIVRWAWAHGITPRFIELMPLGEGASLLPSEHLPTAGIRRRLSPLITDTGGFRDPGAGPAQYHQAADGSGNRVGVIGAMSDNFCESCNRIRLTSRGEIVACIASRSATPLGQLIRARHSDRELAWAIHRSLDSKLAGHLFTEAPFSPHGRGMSLVGG